MRPENKTNYYYNFIGNFYKHEKCTSFKNQMSSVLLISCEITMSTMYYFFKTITVFTVCCLSTTKNK